MNWFAVVIVNGIAISPRNAERSRVIWSNGSDRISMLNYETLEVIAELELVPPNDPAWAPLTEAAADTDILSLDTEQGEELAPQDFQLAATDLSGWWLDGVYNLLNSYL